MSRLKKHLHTRTYFGYRLPDYDKPHRCPVRSGSGFYYPVDGADYERCRAGMVDARDGWARQCPECGQKVLGYWVRLIDPFWLTDRARRGIDNWWYDLKRRLRR